MQMNEMTWPEQCVVDRQMGSLPMGGAVADAPIHTFAQSPAALCLGPQPLLRTRRSEIDLGGLLAFAVDEVVTAEEADAIVAASEYFGFRDEAPGISTPPGMRMNKAVHWVADEATCCRRRSTARGCTRPCRGASTCTATTTATSSTATPTATGPASA